MATRTAELQIKVQGAQTLGELEEVLSEINEEIKDVDRNSDAFDELASAAREADAQIKDLNTELEGVTSTDKADGILKLANGALGAVEAFEGMSVVLGDNNEQLEEVIKRVTGFVLVVDGAQRVIEAFDVNNRKFLKAAIEGWQNQLGAVRNFSRGTRIALATTGIGLLVVAVGLLAANWDKVNEAIQRLVGADPISKLEKDVERLNKRIEQTKLSIDIADSLNDSLDNIITTVDGLSNEISELEKTMLDLRLSSIEPILDDFDEWIKMGMEVGADVNEIAKQYSILYGEAEAARDEAVRVELERLIFLVRQLELRQEAAQFNEDDIENLEKLSEQEKERLERYDEIINKLEIQKDGSIENIDAAIAWATALNLPLTVFTQVDEINEQLTEKQRQRIELQEQNNETERQYLETLLEETIITERLRLIREQIDAVVRQGNAEDIIAKQQILQLEASRLQFQLEINKETEDYLNKLTNVTGLGEKLIKLWNEQDASFERLNDEVDQFFDSLGEVPEEVADEFEVGLFTKLRVAFQQFKDEREESIVTTKDEIEAFAQDAIIALGVIQDYADTVFTFFSDRLQQRIQNLESDLNNVNDEITQTLLRQEELQELLHDANGDRHQEILDQINEEEKAEQQLLQNKLNIQKKLSEERTKQAKLEKAQAIVQSIIATALAVVQALPIIPLAIAVGVLGAAQTALISSQPIPEEAGFKDGGFTSESVSDSTPAGIVHANEYVVPADVLRSRQGAEMVAALEGMRLNQKGFQTGGLTTPPDPTVNRPTITRQLEDSPIFVSVTEIRDVGNNVNVIESKSSL